jgi:two-component system alkaline phosphatase synthesis response regulator PhoP
MTPDRTNLSILLIDDDYDLAASLSVVLERQGYSVRHAPDGESGIRMASEQRPDLVLLDFMMPGKNGFETCSELRQMPDLADTPIVALTAFGQDIGRIHGFGQPDRAGLQDYLEKPVEFNVLLDRVGGLLSA